MGTTTSPAEQVHILLNRAATIVRANRDAELHSSAVVCLLDASELHRAGNLRAALRRALQAVTYVVGVFDLDYVVLLRDADEVAL